MCSAPIRTCCRSPPSRARSFGWCRRTLHPETIEFNVAEVLIGNANIDLQPFDTIRILGRYEADAPQGHDPRRSAAAGRLSRCHRE